MADEDQNNQQQNPVVPPEGTPPPAEAPKFTQEDLNRIDLKGQDTGKRQATREILDALGVEKIDDVKAILDQIRQAELEKMSEADRAKAEAETAKQEAERLKAEAATDRKMAKIGLSLIGEVADPKSVPYVTDLIGARVQEADEEQIKAAIEAVKGDLPALFVQEGQQPAPAQTFQRPPSSNPPGTSQQQSPPSGESEGLRRSKERWAQRQANS